MMKFLRSQSQTVLVVVLGVIGLGFLFYGNSGNFLTTGGGHTSNDYGRIDGEDLTVADLTEAVRNMRYGMIINGHADQLRQPGAATAIAEEAWNQLLLLHEADQLHITINDDELVKYIQGLPIFQKDGVYSPEAYEAVMTQLKDVLHVTADVGVDPIANTKAIFEKVLRDNLVAQATLKALFAGVRGSAHDISGQYDKYYGPATVSVVTFDPKDYIANQKISPADIEAEYKANPTNPAYRTPEKRKVDYVLFLLSPSQAAQPEAQKKAAKDALGEKALDFALTFQPEPSENGGSTPPPPDFMAQAKKLGLTPATTDFFAADTPPANVPPSPAFNSAAFSLSQENPISKVVELENGVAVLHLDEIQPSELRPLSEVSADIAKKLAQDKAVQAAGLTAQIMGSVLKSAVASGTDFKTAATGLKQKVETLPAFVPAKVPSSDQKLQSIAYASTSLASGQVAGPVPIESDQTTVIIHLDSRDKADPAGLADFEARFRESQDQQLQSLVYTDWANWKSKQPGTHRPPDLDSFGSVE